MKINLFLSSIAVFMASPVYAVTFIELQQVQDDFVKSGSVSNDHTITARYNGLEMLLNNIGRATVHGKALTFGAGTTVFGNAFGVNVATVGANTKIYGNVISGGYIAVDSNTKIDGSLIAADAVSVGASSEVGGYVLTGAAATIGRGSSIGGAVTSGAATSIGGEATVNGAIASGGGTTVGASTIINGRIESGAAVTVGSNSVVNGTVSAIDTITLGTDARSGNLITLISAPSLESPESTLTHALTPEGQDIDLAQKALTGLGQGTPIPTSIVSDLTLISGLYSVDSLSTAAGINVTLDGQGKANQVFIFTILGSLTTGAGTTFTLINPGSNTSIIWNVGSFASLGADTTFLGSIFAKSYVTAGARSTVSGVDGALGGVYSAESYVVTGADTVIGTGGNNGSSTRSLEPPPFDGGIGPLPEPSTWAMMICGFGFVGAAMRRRTSRRALCSFPIASN